MEPDVSEFSVRPARTQPRAFSISSIYSKKTAIADSWGRVQHMNHGPAFHAYMRHLQKEVEVLRGQGHFGEGPVPPLSDLPFVGYLTGIGDLSFLLFDALLDGNLQGSIRLASGWGVERRTWRTRSAGRISPSTSYVYSFPAVIPFSKKLARPDLFHLLFDVQCGGAQRRSRPRSSKRRRTGLSFASGADRYGKGPTRFTGRQTERKRKAGGRNEPVFKRMEEEGAEGRRLDGGKSAFSCLFSSLLTFASCSGEYADSWLSFPSPSPEFGGEEGSVGRSSQGEGQG